MKKICDTLAETPLFAGLNHDLFHEYCGKTSIRLVWKGEVLINEGDPCNGIGMIIDGQLAMQKYTSAGDFATLELLGAGEIFGEYLIFGNKKTYSVTIEAVTNSKIIFISREMLMTLLYQSPAIMKNFLTILSDRVLSQNRRISLLSRRASGRKSPIICWNCFGTSWKRKGRAPRLFARPFRLKPSSCRFPKKSYLACWPCRDLLFPVN
jgi:CRP/FNR family transcriptional regulator, dissimilatory nitrate respiration regulator